MSAVQRTVPIAAAGPVQSREGPRRTGSQTRKPREGLAGTTLLVGLLSSTLLVAITPINDNMVQGTYIAGNHFPFGAFAVLLLLCLVVNPLVRRLRPRWAVSPAQLIAIWAMIAVPSGIPSSGLMRYLVPNLTGLAYYATAENKRAQIFGPEVDDSLRVTDVTAARAFYEGLPAGARLPWRAWGVPMAVWSIYTLALYVLTAGLGVLLRRRWVDEERLAFPLVQVPIALVRAPQPGRLFNDFLRSGRMWAAVLLVTVLHTLNGLHLFYPQVPHVKLAIPFRFNDYPWRHATGMWITFYPLVLGFGYLLTTEVLFSLWFFHLFYKARAILFGVLGMPMMGSGAAYGGPRWAVLEEAGGTLGLAGWFFWVGREYYGKALRQAFTSQPLLDDREEPMAYRAAVFAVIIGGAILVAWLTHFGGSFLLATVNVVLGACVFITLAWAVAQGGLIFLQPTFASTDAATALLGSRPFSLRALVVNMLNEQVYRMDLREYMLPSLLNAFRACDDVHLDRRALLTKGVVPGICLALGAGGVVSIALPYLVGGALSTPSRWTYHWAPQLAYLFGSQYAVQTTTPDPALITHFLAGMAGTLAITGLRKRLPWFSLHPIGFLIGSGFPIGMMWFPLLIAWIIKGGVMRWGGYKAYENLRPFFLGLIVGDTLNGLVWIVVGLVTRTGYAVLPG